MVIGSPILSASPAALGWPGPGDLELHGWLCQDGHGGWQRRLFIHGQLQLVRRSHALQDRLYLLSGLSSLHPCPGEPDRSELHGYADPHGHSDFYTDQNPDIYIHAHVDQDADTHCHADPYANANSDQNIHLHANQNPDCHIDIHTHTHAHAYTDKNAHIRGYVDIHTYIHTHAYTDKNAHIRGYVDIHTYIHTLAYTDKNAHALPYGDDDTDGNANPDAYAHTHRDPYLPDFPAAGDPLTGQPCLIPLPGPGDSRLVHPPDEHISLDEYRRAVGVFQSALERLCQGI